MSTTNESRSTPCGFASGIKPIQRTSKPLGLQITELRNQIQEQREKKRASVNKNIGEEEFWAREQEDRSGSSLHGLCGNRCWAKKNEACAEELETEQNGKRTARPDAVIGARGPAPGGGNRTNTKDRSLNRGENTKGKVGTDSVARTGPDS
jgi:hypothetical protein